MMRVFDRIYNEGLKFDAVNKTDVLCMPGMLVACFIPFFKD